MDRPPPFSKSRLFGGSSLRQFDRAAGLLDLGDGRGRSAGNVEGQLRGQLAAAANQAHAVTRPAHDAGRDQRLDRDRGGSVELLRFDRGLDAAELDLVEVLGGR
jgi:hypothetical protein